jgi:hypothetical protein
VIGATVTRAASPPKSPLGQAPALGPVIGYLTREQERELTRGIVTAFDLDA